MNVESRYNDGQSLGKMVMSGDALSKAVNDLSEAELENLMCRVRAVRTKVMHDLGIIGAGVR